jgi:hypothetical protein
MPQDPETAFEEARGDDSKPQPFLSRRLDF